MKNKPKKELRWLWRQAKPFLALHLSGAACVLIGGWMTLLDPLIIKWLIDDVLPRRSVRWLPVAAGAFLASYLGRLAFNGVGGLLVFRAMQSMAFRIKLRLLRQFQSLGAEYHDRHPVGETLYRLEQDVEQVGQFGGDFIPACLRLMVVAVSTLVIMLAMNWRLTLVVMPLSLVFLLARHHYRKRLRRSSEAAQEQASKMCSFLQEHLSALTQVQLLGRELTGARRLARLSSRAVRLQVERRKTELAFSFLSLSIVMLSVALALGYGGYQVISSGLTAGGLVAFYSYTLRLFEPLTGVIDLTSRLQRAGASARRIIEVMETASSVKDIPSARPLSSATAGEIQLKDVSFAYSPERIALKRINLTIKAGEKVALVGANGSGKSTLVKLLVRLYDASGGGIFVDGEYLREFTLKSLRSVIALVPQETILFDATLRENIRCGNPAASQDDLEIASGQAQLEGLIKRLPSGWDEPLGPRGIKLSGGERQRIALARAILQQPRILLLDEPTAALDETAEAAFWESVSRAFADRTVILISHQWLSIGWADRIILLDQGQVVADGPRTELFHQSLDFSESQGAREPWPQLLKPVSTFMQNGRS